MMSKTALITHADNEFGKAVVTACVERAFQLMITGQHKATLYALDDMVQEIGGNAISLVANLEERSETQKLIDISDVNFGEIDVIFHLPPSVLPFDKQVLWTTSSNHLSELIPFCEWMNRSGGGKILYFSIIPNVENDLFKAIAKNEQDGVENLKRAYPKVTFLQLEMKTQGLLNQNLTAKMMEAIFYVLDAPEVLQIDRFSLKD